MLPLARGIFGLAFSFRLALLMCGLLADIRSVYSQSNVFQPDVPEILTRTWQIEDGLPQNSVNCFAQTPDGYLWFGTFNGLVRFDGIRFKVYDSVNTPGLAGNRIVRLFCDRAGQLWMVNETGALSVRKDAGFVSLGAEAGLVNERINSLGEDKEGRVYIGTASGALFRWNETRFETVLTPNSPNLQVPPIFQIEPHPQDGVLIVCDGGRAFHIHNSKPLPFLDPDGRSDEIRRIARARDGGFWIAAVRGVYHWKDGQWTRGRWRQPDRWNFVWSMVEDREGNLWMSQYNEDFWCFRASGAEEPVAFKENPSFAKARPLFEDREGNLWIGTDGEGLVQIRSREIHTMGRREGLRQNMVMTTTEDPTGALWFGYNTGGIDRMDMASGKIEPMVQMPELTEVAPVWKMITDRTGGIWVSLYNGGIIHYVNGRFSSVSNLSTIKPLTMFEDRDGDIWVGARNERGQLPPGLVGGLARIHQGIGTNYSWRGAEHDGVRAIAGDSSGAIWLGTDGAGLFKLTDAGPTPVVPSNGPSVRRITSLVADQDGNLWIGTFQNGLVLLREGRAFAFNSSRQFAFRSVSSLTLDAEDHLWIGTEQGVIRMPRRQLIAFSADQNLGVTQIVLNKLTGLPSLELNGPVYFAKDGRAWIPTTKGAGWFIPAQLRVNTNPPPVRIESITINGVQQELEASDLQEAADDKNLTQVVVPAGNRTLQFHYTAMSFSNPEAVRFRFRLEGVNDEWVLAEGRRIAFYTLVPPGNYRFQVTAANDQGVWNPVGTVVSVTVKPFVWQTGWFQALALLALVGMGAGITAKILAARLRREMEREEERNTRLRADALAAANKLLEAKTGELEDALSKVKTLRGLIPICASCKKIRDDQGYWNRVESYIQDRSEATFSHGLCPDCIEKQWTEFSAKLDKAKTGAGNSPPQDAPKS
jgi:ligand-binding sensor domain-containing protein